MTEYRQRVDNTDGVEWKRRLCQILYFTFNSITKHESTLENTLVIEPVLDHWHLPLDYCPLLEVAHPLDLHFHHLEPVPHLELVEMLA
jgi:hypothetical protein